MKKINIFIITILLFTHLFISGCTDQSNDYNNDSPSYASIYDFPLINITLTETDFPSSYTMISENHTTNPTTVENITGMGLTWTILERYDAFYYENVTNGVVETIMKFETMDLASNLTTFSKNNILSAAYNIQEINPIGDVSYLLNSTISTQNTSYQYYTLLFSINNIFVALGGSVPEQSTFVQYAKTIEANIANETSSQY